VAILKRLGLAEHARGNLEEAWLTEHAIGNFEEAWLSGTCAP
jgi:hypothetical protein